MNEKDFVEEIEKVIEFRDNCRVNGKEDWDSDLRDDIVDLFDSFKKQQSQNFSNFVKKFESFISVNSHLNPLNQDIKNCIIDNFRELAKEFGVEK